jgi:DNA end-binding protein Ku
MTARATWSGTLAINALFQAPVQTTKATDDDYATALKEVCDCCHKPFSKPSVCEAGNRRLTEAMRKSGDIANTTEMLKAVQVGEDDFVVIPEQAFEGINDATKSPTIEPIAVVDKATIPFEALCDVDFLRANAKMPGAVDQLGVIHKALQRDQKVLLGKWAPRNREHIVAIYPAGDVLYMSTVRYKDTLRDPGEAETAHCRSEKVDDATVNLACQLLAALPSSFDHDGQEDRSVVLREAAIKAVLDDQPVVTTAAQKPSAAAPDLLAALEASIAAMTSSAAHNHNSQVTV